MGLVPERMGCQCSLGHGSVFVGLGQSKVLFQSIPKQEQSLENSLPIQKRLQELLEVFETLGGWSERYQYLVDLGRGLEGLDPLDRNDSTYIPGCLSPLWLVVKIREEQDVSVLQLKGDAEGVLPRGLVALMEYFFDGIPVAQLAQWTGDLGRLLGLDKNLTPTRAAAFVNLQKRVREVALNG